MNKTRQLAERLREEADTYRVASMREAATVIDTLLDAIEAGGMVAKREAPAFNCEPLRALREWHNLQWAEAPGGSEVERHHAEVVRGLNVYFPPNDQL